MTDAGKGRRWLGSHWKRTLVLVFAWACLTGILIAVGVWVTHSSAVNDVDRHVTSVVVAHRSPGLDSAMKVLTWMGSWVALVATGILLVVLVRLERLPMVAVLVAIVAWTGESGGVALAKHVVHRSRPPPDVRLVAAHGWSWPSGHTAVAVVVFTTLALVATGMVRGAGYRALVWVLATLAVGAVAFSRIELGVHWSTDVVAAMVFVPAWLLAVSWLFASEIHPTNARGEQRGNGEE